MNAPIITTFDPSQDSAHFRRALGQFATGLTIITTDTPEGPVGIAANSFASVSLDPPLILWSPAKSSTRFDDFVAATTFTVHVLSAGQQDICANVAASKNAINDVPTDTAPCGMQIITGALASFSCRLETSHDAGDHVIIIGRVTTAYHNAGDPLIFSGGQYGHFSAI